MASIAAALVHHGPASPASRDAVTNKRFMIASGPETILFDIRKIKKNAESSAPAENKKGSLATAFDGAKKRSGQNCSSASAITPALPSTIAAR
jgi:hypothetical protein